MSQPKKLDSEAGEKLRAEMLQKLSEKGESSVRATSPKI
jgi:hypothetical protein